ncbi:MAG TPA: hypothetical protein VK530_05125 [Candidatus Acidoferrum sp.]|nr:hypothetical protein [Candidatus Acidoferrum sp.]
MNLDEAQRSTVSQWIEQGLKLSEIQNKLATEFKLSLTYMDVRFLIDDLKLKVKDAEPPAAHAAVGTAPGAPAEAAAPPAGLLGGDVPGAPPATGGVSLSVDHLARAGALVSGKVKFSDGKTAEWYLDQQGRLGLAAAEKGYRPSEQDVMDFQAQLQTELAKLGF